AVVGRRRIEHPDLGHAGQAAAGKGEQGDRGSGALLGGSGSEVFIGDPGIESAGEKGRLLPAAGRERGGAGGVPTIGAWRQCDSHGGSVPPGLARAQRRRCYVCKSAHHSAAFWRCAEGPKPNCCPFCFAPLDSAAKRVLFSSRAAAAKDLARSNPRLWEGYLIE